MIATYWQPRWRLGFQPETLNAMGHSDSVAHLESGYYIPDEWRALRGFDPASVSGDGYYLGALEYRLPLWWIDWGYNVTPLFLRSLSVLYLPTLECYTTPLTSDQAPLMGMGAELRITVVSWGLH